MDTTILTNILFTLLSIFLFFVIAGSVFIIVTLVSILKSLNKFINLLKEETEKVAKDIEGVRGKIKGGEAMIVSSLAGIFSFFKNYKKRSKK